MNLRPRFTLSAIVDTTPAGWHLQIPAGKGGGYRLAQVDNYSVLSRRHFPCIPPVSLNLVARSSSPNPPGTWGFGFWNDPFAFSAGLKGQAFRLPSLPNACWFFYASPENHLSFHNQNPGSGFLAQTFKSAHLPAIFLLPGLVTLPLLYAKPVSRWLRNLVGKFILEDSRLLDVDPTQWHAYNLLWEQHAVTFSIDGKIVYFTPVSPAEPLGVVIWIDNQFAAWTPGGKIRMGTLPNEKSEWLEIQHVEIKSLAT